MIRGVPKKSVPLLVSSTCKGTFFVTSCTIKKKYFLVYHINLLKGGVTLKFKSESENLILKHRDPLVYEKSRNLSFEFVILVSYYLVCLRDPM